jgi:hypothetical protein
MSRLLVASSESDVAIHKAVKTLYGILYFASPEQFWSQWLSAKSTEKRATNALFGSRDLSLDHKELDTARKVC